MQKSNNEMNQLDTNSQEIQTLISVLSQIETKFNVVANVISQQISDMEKVEANLSNRVNLLKNRMNKKPNQSNPPKTPKKKKKKKKK